MTPAKVSRVLICLALLIVFCTVSVSANEVNDFYQRFIELMKKDRSSEMEFLVRDNKDIASKCLQIIREKISKGDLGDKIEGYRLVAEELEELLLVLGGRQDCEAAQEIYARAAKSVTANEQLIRLKRVLRLCPGRFDAQTSLGDTNRKMGRFEDAVKAYEKAMILKKDSPEACLGLGETLFAAGLYQRSLTLFEKTLAIDPDNSRAKKLSEMARREIAQEKVGPLSSDEIADRLQRDIGGNLMCMCPVTARLAGRVRLHEVTFLTGSVSLSLRAKKQLQEVAIALKSDRLKDGNYLIEGHADPTGSAANNQILSQERSEAVQTYLTQILEVDPALITAAGMGDSRWWIENKTSQARRKNRRIEILRLEHVPQSSDAQNLM